MIKWNELVSKDVDAVTLSTLALAAEAKFTLPNDDAFRAVYTQARKASLADARALINRKCIETLGERFGVTDMPKPVLAGLNIFLCHAIDGIKLHPCGDDEEFIAGLLFTHKGFYDLEDKDFAQHTPKSMTVDVITNSESRIRADKFTFDTMFLANMAERGAQAAADADCEYVTYKVGLTGTVGVKERAWNSDEWTTRNESAQEFFTKQNATLCELRVDMDGNCVLSWQWQDKDGKASADNGIDYYTLPFVL